MSKPSGSKKTLARRTWRLMFDLLIRSSPERSKSLARRGLTPNDSRTLSTLDLVEGRTMRSLAEEWGCDASNTTWIVDRLEKMGFAERRSMPGDRRVKLVGLTKAGLKTRTELLEEFYAPPVELLGLDQGELDTLHALLEKLSPLGTVTGNPPMRVRQK